MRTFQGYFVRTIRPFVHTEVLSPGVPSASI